MAIQVIVSGGGIDSAALIYANFLKLEAVDNIVKSLDTIIVAHVDYEQKASTHEQAANIAITNTAYWISPVYYELMPIGIGSKLKNTNPYSILFGGKGDSFIRGRNLTILNEIALNVIQKKGTTSPINLQLGLCLERMMFSDADYDFVVSANKLFNASYGTIDDGLYPLVKVSAPFLEKRINKLDMIKMVIDSIVSRKTVSREKALSLIMDLSFTCWTPNKENKECGECYHCTKKIKLIKDLSE